MPNADDSLPPAGPMLRTVFEALVGVLNERRVRYAIIGGLATIQHARVRTTDDIDVLLTEPAIAMPGLFEALRERGFDVVDVMQPVRELRDDGLTTLRFGEVLVDVMRPVLPAYSRVLDRAITATILGRQVPISSAESLIVMKLIAMRPQDESDVRDLLAAYPEGLDLEYIRTELSTLADADDSRIQRFEHWVRESGQGSP